MHHSKCATIDRLSTLTGARIHVCVRIFSVFSNVRFDIIVAVGGIDFFGFLLLFFFFFFIFFVFFFQAEDGIRDSDM